jgi:hypothetical protein
MNTFTAQDLADFYQKVADGGESQTKIDGEFSNLFVGGPSLGSRKEVWRIKPTKKVIDLSVLIESEVLCVFFDQSTPSSATGKLKKIRGSAAYVSNNRDSSGMPVSSRACKPLMNHKHAWQGGDCPLPEGFMVDVIFRDGSKGFNMTTCTLRWSCEAVNSDVIQFEVLGLADGYVMPWESE